MKIEPRYTKIGKKHFVRSLVIVVQSERESKILDKFFGSKVDSTGLISSAKVDCKLSDGYGEHYLYIHSKVNNEKKNV